MVGIGMHRTDDFTVLFFRRVVNGLSQVANVNGRPQPGIITDKLSALVYRLHDLVLNVRQVVKL
jgi:hypothetical protein